MASRYDTILTIAAGGMATVYVGAVRGALGFRQLVALKKPHPHLLADPSYRSELIAEARIASMIHHANVVDVRDVEAEGEQIVLVMDYIEGASLGDLLVAASKAGKRVPPRVITRIVLDALAGLAAAHDLVDERDRPVGLVHRDVSPQNILVGSDGSSRVTDFGVAKFARRKNESSEGSLKGKIAYMAPEYLLGEKIDRRFDIFATGIVLWEGLAGRRLFRGDNEADTMRRVLEMPVEGLPDLSALDPVISAALAKDRNARFSNATAMASALEQTAAAAGLLGNHGEVAACVKEMCGAAIEERRSLVRSKLAHEPSFGSLLGVTANTVPPDTIVDAASTIPDGARPATPRMDDAPPHPSALTDTATMTAEQARPTTQAARTLKMDDAPAAAGSQPALPMRTLPSAHSEPDTQLSFQEPSAHAIPIRRPNKWIVPLLAGAATMIVASVGIGYAMRDAKPTAAAPPAESAPPVVASSAPTPAVSVPPPVEPSAPSAAPSAKKAPVAPPKPTTKPIETGPKHPPKNPYEDPP